jgi:DNA repair protein RecO (recombination protein O)
MKAWSPGWVMTERKVPAQEAFVLHAYPYRETSLLVEVLTRGSGRMSVVARGARRPRSPTRGALMAFQPLSLSWYGKGEVKTLGEAEWIGGQPLLTGEALLCGFYLNELLVKLLAREDPHEELFDRYRDALRQLAAGDASPPILRAFEKTLLRELGYAMTLDREAGTGNAIDPDALYTFDPERGPVALNGKGADLRVAGRTLLALSRDDFGEAQTLAEAKALMRSLISHRLDFQPLNSRRIFKELLEL